MDDYSPVSAFCTVIVTAGRLNVGEAPLTVARLKLKKNISKFLSSSNFVSNNFNNILINIL